MAIYEFADLQPVVEPGAYVHPEATLIGDVWIMAGAYIAPQAVLRGDYGRLIVENEANVQDGCVLHGYAQVDTVVGTGSSVGHGAVLHGCRIGRNCLVGINAVALDGAWLGDDSILAAMSLLPSGYRAASGQLFKGMPARPTRAVTQQEMTWNRLNAREYAKLASRAPAQLRACQALSAWPKNRSYLSGTTDVRPIHDPDDDCLKGQKGV